MSAYAGEPENYNPDTYYAETGYYYPDEDPANYTATFRYYGGGTEDLRARTGQEITVVRELGDTERDAEVGRMFRVRFADGTEADAFEEEVVR